MSSPNFDYDSFDGETFDPQLDQDRLDTLLDRVRSYTSDGRWYTLDEIVTSCGGTTASVSARLRDLRKAKFGSHRVERRRGSTPGVWEYRVAGSVEMGDAEDILADIGQ